MATSLLQDWQCSIRMQGLVKMNKDVNPVETRKGATLHVDAVITELQKQPKSVTTPGEKAQFTTSLQMETEMSNSISDAISRTRRWYHSKA